MPSARSGNPAKRAAAKSAAPEVKPGQKVWGKNDSGAALILLTVPSGETCRVIRPGVEGLIQAGVLHDIDSLTALVDEKHLKRVKGQQQVDVQSLLADSKNLENLFHVVERVVSYVVREPVVKMTPEDPTNRQAGDHIYCDQIDLEDKMFIFDYAVGGTKDIESFRAKTQLAMGSLADEQGVAQNSS
jgi:hypothetical protein